ncbi:YdcF family protein [Blastomonas sp. AAP53]|uniref:YdcF family protein n=1 Tax=Blastomonas sp. AAP53 TaxID=1248760 RepID=UPI0002E6EA55|nr:YdcF family protein [Blastomonas sp. AAP53]
MIVRFVSSVLLAWILGFAWFAILLPQPLGDQQTDAVVVPTGGPLRIDRGLQVLREQWADRMLISGVDRDVRPAELSAQYPGSVALFDCCVDLGFRAYDTRSNGLETARWAKQRKVESVRLVTTDWHMRRAEYELRRSLPEGVLIYTDAVVSKPSLMTLWREYNKLVLRWLAGLFGV